MFDFIKKHYLAIFAVITLAASLVIYISAPSRDELTLVKEMAPAADSFEKISNDPVTFRMKQKEIITGYASVGKSNGYQSEVSVITLVDTSGRVMNVKVLEQNETPVFFARLLNRDFFDQFTGMDIRNGMDISKNIDAVSSATTSSKAFTKAVNSSVYYIGKNYLNVDVPVYHRSVEFGFRELSVILLMALAVFATYARKSKLKIFASIYSVIILGFWYNSFISYDVLVSLLAGHLPSPEKVSWYILFGGAVSLILITGRNLYCMWICPFGATQDLINMLGFKGFRRNPQINRYALKLPAFLAWFAAVSALLSGNPTIAGYEPFATLFCQVGSSVHWLLLPIIIFSGLFIRRFWCTYFCPVGYVFNRMSVYSRKIRSGLITK